VLPELDALTLEELSPLNVDIVSATSIVLGVVDRILPFKDRITKLPEFNAKHLEHLTDYALAAWFAHVTNLPAAEPKDADALFSEIAELRAKLLLWAAPLAASGYFEPAAVDKIKEGSGFKDAVSDVLALVGLYRARWDQIADKCDITEAQLVRGAQIAPTVFAIISRRENKAGPTTTDGALRVRRAWTLVDRAYAQCRRALQFLRFEEDDVDRIAPNLRRNSGNRGATSATPVSTPAPVPTALGNSAPVATPTLGVAEGGLGGHGSPFASAPRA
jgi:hypothetical protein